MWKERRRGSIALGLLVVLALLLSPLAQAPVRAQEKVIFGSSTGGGARLVSDVMAAKGLDKQYGLDVDYKYFAGPKAIQGLILGSVDVSYFSPLIAAEQLAEGHHLVNFEIVMDAHVTFLKPAGAKLNRFEDLKGKRLGFIQRSSSTYNTFRILCAVRGCDPEKDYKLIIGNPVALMAFISRKEVDASIHFEPFTSMLIANGEAEEMVWFEDLWNETTKGVPLLFSTLGGRKAWLDAHPKAARGLARAVGQARAWILAHPDEALQIGGKSLKISDPKVIAVLKQRMIRIYKTPWDDKAIEAGRWQIKKAVELGIVKKAPDKELFAKF